MKTIKQCIKLYNSLAAPVKASLWFIIMSVLQKGISFLVTPIYTRLLTTDEYGYYSLYTSWLGVFGVFATLNLSAGVFNNGMIKFEDDRHGFISSIQGLSSVTTIFVAALVILFQFYSYNVTGLDNKVIVCMFICLFFNQSLSYWTEYQRYNFKYRMLVVLTIIMSLLTPTLSIFLIYTLEEKKYAVIFGYAIIQIIVGVYFYIYNWLKGKKLFDCNYWIYALKFNVPLIPHYLSYIILGQADRIMINMFCGSECLGVYSLAYSISLLVNIVVNAVNSVLTPWMYRKIKKCDYSVITKYTTYILLLMAPVTVLAILVAPELIAFLGTEEYMEAKLVVPPVMLSCFFTMIYNLFGTIEFYFEKSIYVMYVSVIAAFSNIILNYFFIPRFGFLAAGYTTLASYILLAMLNYLAMRKLCKDNGIKEIYNMKAISVIAIATLFVGLFIIGLYEYYVIRYAIVVFAIFIAIIWRKKLIRIIEAIRSNE